MIARPVTVNMREMMSRHVHITIHLRTRGGWIVALGLRLIRIGARIAGVTRLEVK